MVLMILEKHTHMIIKLIEIRIVEEQLIVKINNLKETISNHPNFIIIMRILTNTNIILIIKQIIIITI
jgi:hypothetical protein